jgi:D-alanyl-D-alanine carboxypeptidase/D-alanyl-D-alanine-endopeptidase (penicillin-binding protein 4)
MRLSMSTVFVSVMLASFCAKAELPVSIVSALKSANIPQQSVAIYVQAVDENSPTLSHNANASMNPASVMKLVTSNAALDLLTPAYRWKTEVFQEGIVSDGILNGNLIIKGYGDPSFNAQEFWRLLMSLQQAGIKEIKGDLIIDKSYFAKNLGGRNAFDNETWRAYNAMPSAFLVNGRNTSFKFSATEGELKRRVNIFQEFELPELEIVNNMRLMQGPCGEWRNHMKYVVETDETLEVSKIVTFSGIFSPECGDKFLELSVFNDDEYAFYTFKKLWLELGGKFNGQLKIQESPIGAVKVLEQLSAPLANVMRDVNKWSNNLMARQLLLTIAAEKSAPPATEAEGARVIKEWFASKVIGNNALSDPALNSAELVMENGSGLSRIERINAAYLSQMLVSAYHSPVMPELISSMPVLALDGTVAKRLNNSPTAQRAHLKTGSLDGVSAIAGYLLDKQNKRYVLVMLVNHAKAGASRAAQDALIEWVYQSPKP